MVEMETRDRIIKASTLADGDQYAEAINLLTPITPDTPHFKDVRDLIDEFAMEQDALERVNSAKAKAAKGRYSEAIATLKDVNKKSKRYKQAQGQIGFYRLAMSRSKPKAKPQA
jgi:predicted Zn-dependent protease